MSRCGSGITLPGSRTLVPISPDKPVAETKSGVSTLASRRTSGLSTRNHGVVQRANAALWLAPNPCGLELMTVSIGIIQSLPVMRSGSGVFTVSTTFSISVAHSCCNCSSRGRINVCWPWLTIETVIFLDVGCGLVMI